MASIFFLNNILLLSVFETGFYFCFSSHFSVIFPVFPFFYIWVSVEMHTFAVSCVRVLSQYYQQKQPPEVFCKKDVLRNFAKFTGKYLCQSLFYEFSKNTSFTERLQATASVAILAILSTLQSVLSQYQSSLFLTIFAKCFTLDV